MYEQAIEFFEQASAVQPSEVKWRLMVTSCYRRLGDYFRALELYQQIHEEHPTNVESLQYLEALCKDLGRPHEEYSAKLEKLRRSQPMPQATQQGAAATRVEQQQTQQQQTQGGNMRSERPSRPDRNNDESNQPAARYVLLRISLLSYICAITVSAILLTNRVCQCL
jgi:intraflagellar transport protein 88